MLQRNKTYMHKDGSTLVLVDFEEIQEDGLYSYVISYTNLKDEASVISYGTGWTISKAGFHHYWKLLPEVLQDLYEV